MRTAPPRCSSDRGPYDRGPSGRGPSDRGSAIPLVIGMVVCLMLLGAGVTAATSAFLARGHLQHACDGAAAAAADAAHRSAVFSLAPDSVADAATAYLQRRDPTTSAALITDADQVQLTCTGSTAITFGAVFGVSEMTFTVQAAGRAVLP